jgi:hypothetical protein
VNLKSFELLLSPSGRSALTAAAALSPTESTFLGCFDRLRKHFPPELAKAALETSILRAKAAGKFSRAAEMFFTREALEQSSGEPVARHRAERFRPYGTVGDFCCGIGGDAIGLAATGVRVVAVDRDPLRLRMAECNIAANGLSGQATFVLRDLLTDPIPEVEAAFADPGRRTGDRRVLRLADYQPPPSAVLARLSNGTAVAFKLAPAIAWEELNPFGGEVEFVSLGGELKECVLWLGRLATTRRRATVLPGGASLAADTTDPPPPLSGPRQFLFDPDPSVTRAGLVTNLGNRLAANMLDPELAFLTSDQGTPTPFATCYEIEAAMPFQVGRLAEALKARGVGRVTVVKRGSAIPPDELVKKWKLTGNEHRIVILTRSAGRPIGMIGTRHEEKRPG